EIHKYREPKTKEKNCDKISVHNFQNSRYPRLLCLYSNLFRKIVYYDGHPTNHHSKTYLFQRLRWYEMSMPKLVPGLEKIPVCLYLRISLVFRSEERR